MSSVNATTLIRTSMQDLGVLGSGEAPTPSDLQDALRRLNLLLSSWAVQSLTVPYVAREVFTPSANVATYTIGPGGTFNTARPSGQASVVGAGLLLQGSSPLIEIPRFVLTYAMYEGIQVKDLTNTLFTNVFYRPTYPLGTIILWPVPTQVNQLVLYLSKNLAQFADLTTVYDLPDGTEEALQNSLTVRLAPMFATAVPPEITAAAKLSVAAMKRNNVQMVDVEIDPMFTMQTPVGGFNIETGNFQR